MLSLIAVAIPPTLQALLTHKSPSSVVIRILWDTRHKRAGHEIQLYIHTTDKQTDRQTHVHSCIYTTDQQTDRQTRNTTEPRNHGTRDPTSVHRLRVRKELVCTPRLNLANQPRDTHLIDTYLHVPVTQSYRHSSVHFAPARCLLWRQAAGFCTTTRGVGHFGEVIWPD